MLYTVFVLYTCCIGVLYRCCIHDVLYTFEKNWCVVYIWKKSNVLYNIMRVKHCIQNFIEYVTFWIPQVESKIFLSICQVNIFWRFSCRQFESAFIITKLKKHGFGVLQTQKDSKNMNLFFFVSSKSKDSIDCTLKKLKKHECNLLQA